MLTFLLFVQRLIKKYTSDEITVYAAQASFFIIMAAFPFTMLMLSIIQVIPSVSQNDLLQLFGPIIPRQFSQILFSLINSLYTESPAALLSLSALAALWSASKGMLGIAKGLNRIRGDHSHRGYIMTRIICSGYTIVFILVLILSLVLLVFGDTLSNFILRKLPFLVSITQYIINVRTLLSLGTLIFCFTGLYTFVPNRDLNWREQIPGALFSTVCWIGISLGFSIYFRFFNKFSYTYGSLTAVVLLMLWLYFCLCALFLGAEINYFYETRSSKKDF
ncbi:MAG: YihY/virulence factor BrkB family protein [Lachnospiraceae bacterium]|jgi:membrane protein